MKIEELNTCGWLEVSHARVAAKPNWINAESGLRAVSRHVEAFGEA
jgi:hypothetical protein